MEDSNNSHGVVVPLIVVYLVWRKIEGQGSRGKGQGTFRKEGQEARGKAPCTLGAAVLGNKKECHADLVSASQNIDPDIRQDDTIKSGPRTLDDGPLQPHVSGPLSHDPGPSQQGTLLGLIGMIASLLFYVFAVLMDIVVFKNIAFVLCVQSTALFVFGWPFVSQFAFPLFFLFFMVPVPVTLYGMIALPMQLFATKISVWVLGHTPLPVTADGNIIRIGEATLEVAEACSGLRSLMSFIMLSMLFAYLAKVSFVKRAVMVAASIPLAICGNIVRVVFTAFVAYFYGSKIASGFIHDVSGYVMFVAAFLVFMWLARVLEGD
jgi:exosortase